YLGPATAPSSLRELSHPHAVDASGRALLRVVGAHVLSRVTHLAGYSPGSSGYEALHQEPTLKAFTPSNSAELFAPPEGLVYRVRLKRVSDGGVQPADK